MSKKGSGLISLILLLLIIAAALGTVFWLNKAQTNLKPQSKAADLTIPGLTALYKMDEPSGDIVLPTPTGIPASASGTTIVPGKIGNAREFSKGNEIIDTKNSSLYNRYHFTFGMWFFPQSLTTSTLFTDEAVCLTYPAVRATQNTFEIWSANKSTSATSLSYPSAPLDTWTYLAFTFDGKNMSVFENGQLVAGPTPSKIPWNSPKSLTIGSYQGLHWDQTSGCDPGKKPYIYSAINGVIDEFSVYNRALTANEVSELAGNLPVPSTTPIPTALPTNPTPTPVGTYFVSPTGSDTNPGSLDSPFKTIQKCAQIAESGNTCAIRAGTYRETVVPTNSGSPSQKITFINYNNEQVTISGTDLVANSWSADSDKIYKTTINPPLPEGQNQVFIDGKTTSEAKWPNSSNLLDRNSWAHAQSATTSGPDNFTINDKNFTGQTNWTGGYILFLGSGQWYSNWGKIISSTPGHITFQTPYGSSNDLPTNPGSQSKVVPYILFGKKDALDSGGEWFLDSSKILYFQTPSDDNPAGHKVEFKKRLYAFDLSGKSNITVKGINIFASTIKTDASSSNITLDDIKGQNISHNLLFSPTTWTYESGIILSGTNNTLENSELSGSSGSGVELDGTNLQVINNVIHNINYTGSGTGAVSFLTASPQTLIKNNTIFDTGSAAIYGHFENSKILNNNLYNSCLLVRDHGIIYTEGDAKNSEVAYNLLHDNKTDYLGVGFYVDSGWPGNVSANYIVHHNVIWNGNLTGMQLTPNFGDVPNNYQIYNNTIEKFPVAIEADYKHDPAQGSIYNNLSDKPIYGTDVQNNLVSANPGFANASDNNYQLGPKSPAIAKGKQVQNIAVFTPTDVGAYQFDVPAWTAGANFSPHL